MKAKMQVEPVESESKIPMVRPVTNWQPVLIAAIAALPPTLIAAAAFWQASGAKTQSAETHQAVNSRMSELLELTRKSAEAKGVLVEKAAQQSREGEAAIEAAKLPQKK